MFPSSMKITISFLSLVLQTTSSRAVVLIPSVDVVETSKGRFLSSSKLQLRHRKSNKVVSSDLKGRREKMKTSNEAGGRGGRGPPSTSSATTGKMPMNSDSILPSSTTPGNYNDLQGRGGKQDESSASMLQQQKPASLLQRKIKKAAHVQPKMLSRGYDLSETASSKTSDENKNWKVPSKEPEMQQEDLMHKKVRRKTRRLTATGRKKEEENENGSAALAQLQLQKEQEQAKRVEQPELGVGARAATAAFPVPSIGSSPTEVTFSTVGQQLQVGSGQNTAAQMMNYGAQNQIQNQQQAWQNYNGQINQINQGVVPLLQSSRAGRSEDGSACCGGNTGANRVPPVPVGGITTPVVLGTSAEGTMVLGGAPSVVPTSTGSSTTTTTTMEPKLQARRNGLRVCVPPEGQDSDDDWRRCNAKQGDLAADCGTDCMAVDGPPFGFLNALGTNGCAFNTCGFDGKSVALRGMSWFWSNWSKYAWREDVVEQLRNNWCATIARFAMGAGDKWEGDSPNLMKMMTKKALRLSMYALLDWHIEGAAGDANQAEQFWDEMGQLFGKYPNTLFEPWNEPRNENPWGEQCFPWHDRMIKKIRQYSDNIIVLGNPEWSHKPHEAVPDVTAQAWKDVPNLQITIHQYAASSQPVGHGYDSTLQSLKDAGRGGLFMTECGVCENNGDGRLDKNSFSGWADWAGSEGIAVCMWSIGNKPESCSAMQPGRTNINGDDLTDAGRFYMKDIIKDRNLRDYAADYNLHCPDDPS
ncbi:unnamed protein product [Amoebophrya sp. A120]|nr:unnamed protein product [Amoebophrya sp. A120]|eukprot:GSA120T00014128001.1